MHEIRMGSPALQWINRCSDLCKRRVLGVAINPHAFVAETVEQADRALPRHHQR